MYSAKLDGERVQFGTSGLLYRSNKLMYDRKTNTLWRQFLGEPVVGTLADSGIHLTLFPVVVTTWREWVTAHPDTTVLDDDTGVYPASAYLPESDPSAIYYSYFNSPRVMFPVWQQSDALETKAILLGLQINGHPKAYPLVRLKEKVVVNDELGGTELVVVTDPAAGAARAYQRQGHTFRPSPLERGASHLDTVLDEQDRQWQVTEEALVRVDEPTQRLERLPGHMAFWFGWYASFPQTQVYSPN